MKTILSSFLNSAVLAGLVFAAASPLLKADDFPPGPGRETLQRVCTACHDIESVPRLRYSRADWTSLVYSMKDMGADASSAELDDIINYLAKNFGKDEAPAKDASAKDSSAKDSGTAKKTNVNKASSQDLAAGLGFSDKEADAIVAYRVKNGDFKDADALAKVDGVDAAKIAAAKDKMEF